MFCRLRFKCRFSSDVLRFGMEFGVYVVSVFRKCVPKIAFRKGPPTSKQASMDMFRGSQRGQKQQFELNMLFEFVSIVRFPKHTRKCCLNWFPLQKLQKYARENIKDQGQKHSIRDLTRPWPMAKAWRLAEDVRLGSAMVEEPLNKVPMTYGLCLPVLRK